jgi:hypothetical protein
MITLVHMIHYYSHLEDGKISVYVIEFVWSSKDEDLSRCDLIFNEPLKTRRIRLSHNIPQLDELKWFLSYGITHILTQPMIAIF